MLATQLVGETEGRHRCDVTGKCQRIQLAQAARERASGVKRIDLSNHTAILSIIGELIVSYNRLLSEQRTT